MSARTTQSDEFIEIDPDLVIVNKKANSRGITADDVNERMRSIATHGQQTPVLVYKRKDGKHELAVGYTRHAAVTRYNKLYPDRARKLLARVIPDEMTPEQAYVASVVENYQRRNPTAIEIARQGKTLMEEFGKSEKDVAEGVFGWKGNDGLEKLRSFQKLLTLPKKVQDKVESKELPYTAAIELAGLEPEQMDEILGSAKRKKSGKIKGESVRKAARAKKGRGGGEGELSRKKIMNFVIGLTGPGEDEPVRTLFRKLEAYFDGKLAFDTAEVWARSLGGAIKSPKTRQEANPEPEPAPDDEETPKKKGKAEGKKKAKKAKKRTSRPVAHTEPEPAPADEDPEPAPDED